MVKFSIGIPAFKSRYLKECLQSVLAQTYTDFELIIINDCSPNAVEEIVKEFSDSRIRYYRNTTNIGALNVVDNWNKCVDLANGEFFVLLGDDDVMKANYLEEFNKLITRNPDLDVYHCRSIIIDENSVPTRVTPVNPDFEDVYDFILSCLLKIREQFISDFVYRLVTLRLNGGFYKLPLAWNSDYLSAYIACGKKGIAHTNEIVFYYRVNRENITSTGSLELKWAASLKYFLWIKSFLTGAPGDPINLLKHASIQRIYSSALQNEKVSYIRQIIGKEKYKGIKMCFKLRKTYKITLVDMLDSFLDAAAKRIRKRKKREVVENN